MLLCMVVYLRCDLWLGVLGEGRPVGKSRMNGEEGSNGDKLTL